jgi:hypothetical protein
MPTYYSIITSKNGVVERNQLLTGQNYIMDHGIHAGKGQIDLAETLFTAECKKIDPKVDDEELEAALDDGYYTFGNSCVCICEPEKV